MKPTEAQINLLYRWFMWEMPIEKAREAAKWAKNNSDKYKLSREMTRIQQLYKAHKLNEERCFESYFWSDSPFYSRAN